MLFADNDLIKTFIPEYNSEYENMTVKTAYETYPKVKYPIITIRNVRDTDVDQYFDGDTTNIRDYACQIEINAEQDEERTAIQNVKRIADIIEQYMRGERYKCMRKIGDTAIVPLSTDNNVAVGVMRYECYLDIEKNIIYRRY